MKPDEILEHIPIYLTRMNADLRKQASLGVEPFLLLREVLQTN